MLQSKKQHKVRNSSIELLRIIAMVMIVFHHFAVHGRFEWDASTISTTRLWYNFIFMGGKIGVNIFVLISGYYLISNTKKLFNVEKTAKFIGQVFFYSIVMFIISGLVYPKNIGIVSFIKACFPITFSQWWFASAYFVLYLLHPFLNKLLHSIDKSLYQKLILFLVICWSIIPTFTTSSYESNSLLWFVTLYTIAGYIKLYGLNSKFALKHYCIFGIICILLTYASSIVFTILGTRWEIFSTHATYFYSEEKITTLLISICLFKIFEMLSINYNKWINLVASATFGVYLIHDSIFMRKFLWKELFVNAQYQNDLMLIPYSIMVVIIVYTACTIIDIARQYTIERAYMAFIKRHKNKLTISINKLVTLVKNFIFG